MKKIAAQYKPESKLKSSTNDQAVSQVLKLWRQAELNGYEVGVDKLGASNQRFQRLPEFALCREMIGKNIDRQLIRQARRINKDVAIYVTTASPVNH